MATEFRSNILDFNDGSLWTLTDAILDASTNCIHLAAGGKARFRLMEVLPYVPTEAQISFHTDKVIDPTHINCFVTTCIKDKNLIVSDYSVPVDEAQKESTLVYSESDYTEIYLDFLALEEDTDLYDISFCPAAATTDKQIETIKSKLPLVLSDYNTQTITVTTEETLIASINSNLTDKVAASAHLLCNYRSSSAGEITLRVYDNDVEELYSPIIVKTSSGVNSLSKVFTYLNRQVGVHNFYVTMQCINTQVTLNARSVLFTIDAGSLAQQLKDIGYEIWDIAIYSGGGIKPEYVYALCKGVSAAIIQRAKCKDDNTLDEWTQVSQITGNFTGGAIEFDGTWALRANKYTCASYNKPEVFLIKENKDLIHYKSSAEQVILAQNVTQCSAVRGFKAESIKNNDFGLIVAYITGGSARYRQFAYNDSSGSYSWANEITISDTASFVRVHRLNDYRAAFIYIDNAEQYHLLISNRIYPGDTVPKAITDNIVSVDRVSYHSCIGISLADQPGPNTNGTPVVIDSELPQDMITLAFTLKPRIMCTLPELLENICLNINGVNTRAINASVEDNLLHIQLPEAILGVVTCTSIDGVHLDLYGGTAFPSGAPYVWYIYNRIRQSVPKEEAQLFSLGTSSIVYSHQILTHRKDMPTEICPNLISDDAVGFSITPSQILTKSQTIPSEGVENLVFVNALGGNIILQQTGITPV